MAPLLGSVASWGRGVEVAQVSLTVNGRSFAITCDDGQETRIRRLGQYVDAKVAEFVGSVGQVGEARLLLLAALRIADELADANEALRLERSGARAADAESALAADAAASDIHDIAQRVEAIAARLETS
jgi:cell division protein ZapA